MYKCLPADIKKIKLNSDLYKLHKNGGKSEFGMDNTSELLEDGFGLYSTSDLKNNIGLVLSKLGTSNTLQNLFKNYLKLVSQNFLSIRRVSDYASMLHVSPDHLSRAIKSCSDKTPHEFIDEMILMEAKAYLLHTKMTISEIAYKLEFNDPSHFNRFFKKCSSKTPLDFRNKS